MALIAFIVFEKKEIDFCNLIVYILECCEKETEE